MSRTPQYVALQKNAGETAQLRNGVWYLVKRTSHRMTGSVTPTVTYVDVAISLPSGRVELEQGISPSFESFECYEFGYSFALWHLCPRQWKSSLKQDWETILIHIIQRQSPSTYLLRCKEKTALPEHRLLGVQEERFWKKLSLAVNNVLLPLKDIHLLFFQGKAFISTPNDSQKMILDQFGISIERCVL